MTDGRIISARFSKDQLSFFCDRCGTIHRHGKEEGTVTSHCKAIGYEKFGAHLNHYVVKKSKRVPGKIDKDEAVALQRIAFLAQSVAAEATQYLEEAGVDKRNTAFQAFSKAAHALSEIASVKVDTLNPLEKITEEFDYSSLPEDEQ